MLFGWSMSDWIILVVDVVAVVLIFRFLSWKIKHKLEEVEQRQKFSLRQKNPPVKTNRVTRKQMRMAIEPLRNRTLNLRIRSASVQEPWTPIVMYVQSERCYDWPVTHRPICTNGPAYSNSGPFISKSGFERRSNTMETIRKWAHLLFSS